MRAWLILAWLPAGVACSTAAPGASRDASIQDSGSAAIFSASEAGVFDFDADIGLECTDASPGFMDAVAPIFAGCGGGELCHGFASPPALYGELVGAPSTDGCGGTIVVPGSLERSYLLRKLTGLGMCPRTQVMPPGGMLPEIQIQTIADWICAGARND